ncbi:MAG: 3-alpha,7-alpha,12-alpha-trihydroxy-5-beta-cholest-24-enoyl-CoA hydratase [Sphingomonadales bacterium]|nr:MAG: 3-alpha,7-alpha,12-alpha-trihydroxy-5-beta-cholest-24-enoyl-CoA hydratase [Sphingomonadales bacterium]
MLDPARVLGTQMPERPFAWSRRDAILYALGVGCGADDRRFVYEDGLVCVPSFATVVCNVKMFDPAALGIDYAGLVHSGQSIELHRPFPPEGEAILSKRVIGLWDRGPERGAVLAVETGVRDAASGAPIATVINEMMARRNGGFGGSMDGMPAPAPAHPPEQSRAMPTREDQALIFRLSGDWNPLHADPETARAAGFPGPILHGMCTYALCCRAVIAEFGVAPEQILRHEARFSAPVYPGETVAVGMARRGDEIFFCAHVGERQVVRNGRTTLRA